MKTIVGLEIHTELLTKTKMFCSCKNEFGQAPNTLVCPVCLGIVGTFPRINKKALELAIRAGIAFDCDIRQVMKFDRKKYFYPDLTKGFQITQQDEPFAEHGFLEIESGEELKKIRIQRIHVEEDTGKSTHTDDGKTLLDFNRAGVPLIEIVTEPDISSAEEARAFLENLRQRLRYIEASDGKMEEGSLRCDVNVNIKDDEGNRHAIVEVKNLNSFRAVERAIQYEEKRQAENLKKGITSSKETRRWDEASGTTILMRKKDEENDYRFTVESDMPRVSLSDEFIKEIRDNLPELPRAKKERFIKEYKLTEYDANVLSKDKELSMYFEDLVSEFNEPTLVSSWILTEMMRRLKEYEIEISQVKLSKENFAKLLKLVKDGKVSNNSGKKIFREIFESNEDPQKVMVELGLEQNNDSDFLVNLVNEVLNANPQSIEDFKAGRDRALGFLMGQVMKQSKGKANPQEASKMIKEELEKR
ncbi:Asp-tRNA(Asn)/Glu-tRNA(Gln) amidotransferase subunit GatB [Helcococcus ovis]|uniref:Aspartyl/glutamyl-tRNA(Asn/Gln) amidotransferase subunit B n=1 Tax=Helcococcus ovis TaxID=72026 RepID=A0A4R9BZS6_9FIRM|nr:Asp-tRNA(Asn)/Glu-tRNA(Gln) amidotransferase subunit GatB [Helcococcus ovis]TFF63968.1 Asp-tRNA(Asn)/Glu-tRNA(Gln) amidotransferase subunit GatB [Helcococcus ovis]TFF64552.1 Asp-tRNA(Asn)/Glu-tRNA(Gln) amidotransferase subunit GatB [Helcococcus ovis]